MARGVSRLKGARSVRLMELERLADAQLRVMREMRGREDFRDAFGRDSVGGVGATPRLSARARVGSGLIRVSRMLGLGRRSGSDAERVADARVITAVPFEGDFYPYYQTLASRVAGGRMHAVFTFLERKDGVVEPGRSFRDREWHPEKLFQTAVEDRYRYLPEIVGFAYFREISDRYDGVAEQALGMAAKDWRRVGVEAIRRYFSRVKYMSVDSVGGKTFTTTHPIPNILAEENCVRAEIDVATERRIFHLWGHMTHFFREVYRRTGDDLIELGFWRYRGSMTDLVEDVIYKSLSALSEKRRKQAVIRRKVSDVRDDVMMNYFQRMDEVSVVAGLTPEAREEGRYLFAAGDYRADKAIYDALRDGGEETRRGVEYWTPRIVEVFRSDERLMGADLIVPVIGKEAKGWPVAILAESVGSELGIEVRRDFWLPRPTTVKDSESPMTFAEKEEQAARAHRFRRVTVRKTAHVDPEIRAAVEGKVVVVFDDMWHTGVTARAVAHELRAAGAREVYIVVATKTNKGDGLGE